MFVVRTQNRVVPVINTRVKSKSLCVGSFTLRYRDKAPIVYSDWRYGCDVSDIRTAYHFRRLRVLKDFNKLMQTLHVVINVESLNCCRYEITTFEIQTYEYVHIILWMKRRKNLTSSYYRLSLGKEFDFLNFSFNFWPILSFLFTQA